ncbi:MAG: hypothetical protein ACYDCL_21485 [Myxococcales bacterium]
MSGGADRTDPFILPTHGNGAQVGPGGRSVGVAQNNILGGVNYGTLAHAGVRAAAGQIVRNDQPQLSRLPVSVVRPIWDRMSLLGAANAEVPPLAVAPPAATGSSVHGAGCLDCAQS